MGSIPVGGATLETFLGDNMQNLSIRQRFGLLIAVFLTGFIVFFGFAYKLLMDYRINSPLYETIIQKKDLIADVLPPPNFIVESY
jgi:hypothetical protein